jgi:5,10-methylene-tetrahydrofolate dehydrogenase/methenyl tetrahydrofolate cyclohydrolase
MAVELFYSDSLVLERRDEISSLLEAVDPNNPAVALAVSTKLPGENAGIDSYLRQLRRDVSSFDDRLVYREVRTRNVAEAAAALLEYAGRIGTSLTMTPTHDPNDLDILLNALSEDSTRDGDAMTPAGRMRHMPATPMAELAMIESMVGRPLTDCDPERTAFIGNGGVNGPLIEKLRNEGWNPIVVDRSNSSELIPRLHSIADRVISAVGVPGLLTPQALLRQPSDGRNPEKMNIVDSGLAYNKNSGMIHGDVDPIMYGYPGQSEISITAAPVFYPDGQLLSRGRGVGRLTVVNLLYNGLVSTLEESVDLKQPAV